MTLLLPTILYSTFNTFIKIMDVTAYTVDYIEQELPGELISWLFIPFLPGNHCGVIQLSYSDKRFLSNTNLFLDTRLASRWLIYP